MSIRLFIIRRSFVYLFFFIYCGRLLCILFIFSWRLLASSLFFHVLHHYPTGPCHCFEEKNMKEELIILSSRCAVLFRRIDFFFTPFNFHFLTFFFNFEIVSNCIYAISEWNAVIIRSILIFKSNYSTWEIFFLSLSVRTYSTREKSLLDSLVCAVGFSSVEFVRDQQDRGNVRFGTFLFLPWCVYHLVLFNCGGESRMIALFNR